MTARKEPPPKPEPPGTMVYLVAEGWSIVRPNGTGYVIPTHEAGRFSRFLKEQNFQYELFTQ